MIVSLRGTNASGKTHLVRSIMARFPKKEEVRLTGRRKPVGYRLHGIGAPLFIPGHYEPTGQVGGTDTLMDTEEIYRLIWEAYDTGYNVIFEGRNTSQGLKLTTLFSKDQAEIVIIDHPLSECIHAIKERGASMTVESIKRIARKIAEDETKFKEWGYIVHRLDRTLALQKCEEILDLRLQ